MILTDSAVVLIRRNIREADRIASVYTRRHGRMNLRFPGVNRQKGKLKAFSEPFVWADYRIYMREHGTVGCAAGGKLRSVFPGIRADAGKVSLALYFCELMLRMTPQAQPSADKYQLLVDALRALETGRLSDGLRIAFTLRLMQFAGHGLAAPVLGLPADFWRRLHEDALASVAAAQLPAGYTGKCDYVLQRFFASHFDRPLKTTAFLMNEATDEAAPIPR